MDFWALRCLEEVAEADAAGEAPPGHTSDEAMADTVMDFLFASQDASTASLVWLTAILAERPDVLQRVCTCCCSSPLFFSLLCITRHYHCHSGLQIRDLGASQQLFYGSLSGWAVLAIYLTRHSSHIRLGAFWEHFNRNHPLFLVLALVHQSSASGRSTTQMTFTSVWSHPVHRSFPQPQKRPICAGLQTEHHHSLQ